MSGTALALLLASLPGRVADTLGEVRAAMTRGAFAEAWALAAAAPEESRPRVRSEILYTAGDPAGALAEARAGLAHAPEDLDLLFYAAGAALWLQDWEAAASLSGRLRAVVEDSALPSGEREAWESVAERYSTGAADLQQRSAGHGRALRRSRLLGLGGLALIVVLIGALARTRPHAPPPS